MVDWDRVQELRSKGWDWGKIAADPKVGFRADASAGDPGRALRALYHRSRARERTKGSTSEGSGTGAEKKGEGTGWGILRIFYLVVPLVGVWFALAYLVPSPIGLVVPALPYLGLVLAGVALVLIWSLWRSTGGRRWSAVYRTTVIGGVILGLVVAGLIGLTGAIAFGCPLLPPAASLKTVSSSPFEKVPTGAWQTNGVPVFYSFGATWCPYCSATSWAEWKALTEFGSVSGVAFGYSSSSDVYAQTPEVVLASIQLGPKSVNGVSSPAAVDFQVSEDTSGVQGTVPGTASCYQQAYLTAYASGIPFIVLNGQYEHDGELVNPADLSNWSHGQNGGYTSVEQSVLNEVPVQGGNAWAAVRTNAWWIMAIITVTIGVPVTTLANEYGWSSATKQAVGTDVSLLG